MKKLRSLILVSVFGILIATPAVADPVTAAVTAASGFLASGTIGATIANFAIRAAASWGLSALASHLSPSQGQQPQPGIRTSATTSGGTTPQTVVLGRYATGGNHVCPPMTHGIKGRGTIDYLTYVIDLADHPISGLTSVYIDKDRTFFSSPGGIYGNTAGTRLNGKAWLRWHDGTQAAADEMLTQIYGSYERPWTADHVLAGVAYAALTFKFDEEEMSGFPEVVFELRGAPLYDPRKDDSVGGSGRQRWNDPTTHEFTENPVVMVYNLLRGLILADGSVYGLRVPADDLPIDRWAAQMSVCDELVAVPGIMIGGSTEPRYRCGIEFSTSQQPLDVIADVLKSCGGQIAEAGGVWTCSVGPADFPRAHITDSDIIVSSDRDRRPFRGLADTYNAAHVSHPSRDAMWEPTDAPPYYRPDLEAEDDGRRLVADLTLPTVTYPYQAQRLAIELVLDNRRMISHTLTLPPSALGLLPLDTITWTSAQNGYTDKLFEIASKTIDPKTLCVSVNLRERDPADYRYDYTDLKEPAQPAPMAPELVDPVEPEDGYTDGNGNPLTPSTPPQSLGDLVALHNNSISRSTDGGAGWVRLPAPWNGGADLSAIEGQGLVVRVGTAAWFSNNGQNWGQISITSAATDAGLLNGDFETGSLSDWSVISGAPVVIDTQSPTQQGGQHYLSGENFEVSQIVSVTAGDIMELTGDVFASGSGEIGMRIEDPNGAVQSLDQNPLWSGQLNIASDIRTAAISNIKPGVRLEWYYEDAGNSFMSAFGQFNGVSNRLQFTDPYWGRLRARFIDQSTGDLVPITGSIAITGIDAGSKIHLEAVPGVDLLPASASDATLTSSAIGTRTYKTLTCNSGSGAASVWLDAVSEFRLQVDPASGVTEHTIYIDPQALPEHQTRPTLLDVSASSEYPEWRILSARITVPDGQTHVEVYARGAGQAWIDNLRLTRSADDGQPRTLARDLRDRRHVIATGGSLHAVAAGAAAHINSTPFPASVVAADGATLLIADGTSIAISTDNGATWSEHIAAAAVVQLIARNRALAILSTGDVVDVSAAGLATLSSLITKHRIERDARRGVWIAVDTETGVILESSDLVAWASAADMPAGILSGGYRITPTDIGRTIGWRFATPDLFRRDLGEAHWSVSWALVDDVCALTEVK